MSGAVAALLPGLMRPDGRRGELRFANQQVEWRRDEIYLRRDKIAPLWVKNLYRKTGIFGLKKWKLIFSAFYSHGSKEKISGSDFEIRATNFKKQGTYFLPRENLF